MAHWHFFVKKLLKLSLIKQIPHDPKGHNYYLFHKSHAQCRDNLFIIGDAAGVSTLDMGEGIHSAIKSGIMAAAAIINHKQFMLHDLKKFSLPGIFLAKNHES